MFAPVVRRVVAVPCFLRPLRRGRRAEAVEPLVTTQWLKDHGRSAIVVLDVRSAIDGGGAEAYARRTSRALCTAITTSWLARHAQWRAAHAAGASGARG
jgi:hypothetical protein